MGVFYMLNYELFRVVVAPEFADTDKYPNSTLDLFAAEAECEVSATAWGCKYDRAVALITAHLISMSKKSSEGGSSGAGQVKKVKVGQLEREYDVGSGSDSTNAYNLTTYGKEFLRLRKQILRGPIFVSGC